MFGELIYRVIIFDVFIGDVGLIFSFVMVDYINKLFLG